MAKDEEIIVVSERIMKRNKAAYKKLAQIDIQCNIAEGCFVDNQIIREYVDDYIKFYPERWRWELKNSPEQNDLYMKTRARRPSKHDYYKNNDLLPDFSSIEKDAAQFELIQVKWTDFFGLIWEGKKGILARAGAPNFKGSLYYYVPEDDYDEGYYEISEDYDAYENQPSSEIYSKVEFNGITHWVDTANVVDAEYKYIVNNHLFKDTRIELKYEDGELINVYSDYEKLISNMLKQGKKLLVEKIFKSMNEHFVKLRDSDRVEVQEFYPGKTAEEIFLGD